MHLAGVGGERLSLCGATGLVLQHVSAAQRVQEPVDRPIAALSNRLDQELLFPARGNEKCAVLRLKANTKVFLMLPQ